MGLADAIARPDSGSGPKEVIARRFACISTAAGPAASPARALASPAEHARLGATPGQLPFVSNAGAEALAELAEVHGVYRPGVVVIEHGVGGPEHEAKGP